MILVVDAGNSRIKWGLHEAGRWQARGALATSEAAGLQAAWSGLEPAWVGVSNVAGETAAEAIRRALPDSGEAPFWLRPELHAHGIFNPYAGLGADRYAALVAAKRRGLGHCVVASLGTALTVDALTAEGEFLGGLIVPGHGLMLRALNEGTAGVRATEGGYADFPGNTADAVETGVLSALAGAVEQMRARAQAALSAPVTVLLAGGDAMRLRPLIVEPVIIAEDLVLEGLVWIAKDRGASGA